MLVETDIKDMTPLMIGESYMKYATKTSTQKVRSALFKCQYCGNEFEATTSSIKRKHTKSCGCLTGGLKTHGLSTSRFYNIWANMKRRCYNNKVRDYKWYGGKGIKVCEEWLDVKTFITWCGETYIEGMTLDRIDGNKNYQPDNCRWVDMTIQNINKGVVSRNNSGHTGISWKKKNNKFVAQVSIQGKPKHIGLFKTKEDAVLARDAFIIEHKLPHKLSIEFTKEIK